MISVFYKTSSYARAAWLQTNVHEVEFLAYLSLIFKRLLKFCIHFLIVLFRPKLSETFQMLRLNVTKSEKKKNVEKLLTVFLGVALLEKIHSRFFASCNQSWNCKSCMKKTALQRSLIKAVVKIFKGWYQLIEECTIKNISQ